MKTRSHFPRFLTAFGVISVVILTTRTTHSQEAPSAHQWADILLARFKKATKAHQPHPTSDQKAENETKQPSPPPSSSKTHHLSLEDHGKTVTLLPGQRIEMKVRQNGGTPYGWRMPQPPAPKVLQVDGKPSYARDPGPEMPGQGGFTTHFFKAVAPGKTKISFVLGSISKVQKLDPSKRVDITIIVAPPTAAT